MKYKREIILSTIFIIFILSFGSPVLAQYDWRMYGNSQTPIWQEQYAGGFGRLDLGYSETTINQGYKLDDTKPFVPFQPIATIINNTGYIIIPNGNYLQVYDKNLNLLTEIYSGNITGQVDVFDFDSSGFLNDINGIWNINSTSVAFRVYTLNINNPSSPTLSQIYEKNFSVNSSRIITGTRHAGQNVYFVINYNKNTDNTYSANFVKINQTGINEVALENSNPNYPYNEPLAWTDMNNDGITEFLTYSEDKILVFQEAGFIYPYNSTAGRTFASVKMFHPESSNIWRLAILEISGSAWYLTTKKLDGSNLWTINGVTGFGFYKGSQIAIVDDYDGDYFNDIYVSLANFRQGSPPPHYVIFQLFVIKGNTGTNLTTYADLNIEFTNVTNNNTNYGYFPIPSSLTIADMNENGKYDFISVLDSGLIIYEPSTYTTLYKSPNDIINTRYSCIPSDINLDGLQEIICSGKDFSQIIFTNGTNQNAVINSVTYSPSTSIIKGTSVNAIISASDYENNNPLYYINKCSNDNNWSSEDTNPIRTCYYALVGIYNLSVGVRDVYHYGTYNYFSQNIIVTETGTICGNSICEAGENYVNCPTDCSSGINTTEATEIGGMPLPTKIVDTENTEQGLLPEIYYGILAFLSGTLTPMIILIFTIFFALIILAVGFIIKKISHKVGDLGK